MRAMMSAVPPGANPTTMRIGLTGCHCTEAAGSEMTASDAMAKVDVVMTETCDEYSLRRADSRRKNMALPIVHVIGTGGSISSIGTSRTDFLDYTYRDLHYTIEEMLARVPEVNDVAKIVSE